MRTLAATRDDGKRVLQSADGHGFARIESVTSLVDLFQGERDASGVRRRSERVHQRTREIGLRVPGEGGAPVMTAPGTFS